MIVSGLALPTAMTFGPDGALYVSTTSGSVRRPRCRDGPGQAFADPARRLSPLASAVNRAYRDVIELPSFLAARTVAGALVLTDRAGGRRDGVR